MPFSCLLCVELDDIWVVKIEPRVEAVEGGDGVKKGEHTFPQYCIECIRRNPLGDDTPQSNRVRTKNTVPGVA